MAGFILILLELRDICKTISPNPHVIIGIVNVGLFPNFTTYVIQKYYFFKDSKSREVLDAGYPTRFSKVQVMQKLAVFVTKSRLHSNTMYP